MREGTWKGYWSCAHPELKVFFQVLPKETNLNFTSLPQRAETPTVEAESQLEINHQCPGSCLVRIQKKLGIANSAECEEFALSMYPWSKKHPETWILESNCILRHRQCSNTAKCTTCPELTKTRKLQNALRVANN